MIIKIISNSYPKNIEVRIKKKQVRNTRGNFKFHLEFFKIYNKAVFL